MERFAQIRNKWPVAALVVFYLYLAFHALSGSQGVMRWVDYESNIEKYQAKLEAAQSERVLLERTAQSLRTDHLDLDLLDEKARELVFVSRPNEVTIWLDESH